MLEWLRDIKDQLGERMRSPLYGVFASSWIVSNWRGIYITLFESKKTLGISKIDYLFYKLYPYGEFNSYGKLFIWPIIATVLYIWCLPYVVHWAFVATEEFREDRKREKLKILKTSIVKGETYIELKRKYDESLEKFAKVIEDSSNSVTRIRELEITNAELAKENEARGNKIADSQGTIEFLRTSLKVVESKLANLKYGPSDIFPDHWQSVYQGSSSGQEIFTITEGYKYLIVREQEKNGRVSSYTHAFDIDRFTYETSSKKVTFRKVGVSFNIGAILEVTLFEKDGGVWEGQEVPVVMENNPANLHEKIERRKDPIKLTMKQVVLAA